MKRGSNTLVLIVAILAFLPVLAVNLVVDSYVRNEGANEVQRVLNGISGASQASIYEGLSALSHVVANSPSFCTPTFVSEAREFMLHSAYLRQITVQNRDGVLYCDVFDSNFAYTPRSNEISVAGRTETVSASIVSPNASIRCRTMALAAR